MPNCELCGEPMPAGEEMFKFHGYSGPCPKPPKERPKETATARAENNADEAMREIWCQWFEFYLGHFRGNVAISAADQTAFYEIAQPIMRKLATRDLITTQ